MNWELNKICPHCYHGMKWHTTCVISNSFSSKKEGYWECPNCKKVIRRNKE